MYAVGCWVFLSQNLTALFVPQPWFGYVCEQKAGVPHFKDNLMGRMEMQFLKRCIKKKITLGLLNSKLFLKNVISSFMSVQHTYNFPYHSLNRVQSSKEPKKLLLNV